MNIEDTLALLWTTEESLEKGSKVERRTCTQLLRALERARHDQLRLGLLRRFRELGRSEPASTERFSWKDRERVHRPTTISQALRVLQEHECTPIGRGHSGTPSQGDLLELRALAGVARIEDAHANVDTDRLVRAQAGITLGQLVQALQPDDLVPALLGGSLDQSVAGAIHTGAHAPGCRPMADAVVSVDVIVDGQLQRFEPHGGITDPLRFAHPLIQDDAAFAAMVVNRGQIGVSVAFTLAVEDLSFVQERTFTRRLDQLPRLLADIGRPDAPPKHRTALTVFEDKVWVHRYLDCSRHQVPQALWSQSSPPECGMLLRLQHALGSDAVDSDSVDSDLLGWFVDLCPRVTRALLADEKRPRPRTHRGWALHTSPTTPAWRVTRETCSLDALQRRLEELLPTVVHPIRVVFAEPTTHHALLPHTRTATIELRTPRHLPAPATAGPAAPGVAFLAQKQLRTRAANPLPETLLLRGLQGDLRDDEAARLVELMQDQEGFAQMLKTVLPEPPGSRSTSGWEDWLGGNRRQVQREKVKNFSDLFRVLSQRGHKRIRSHGKRHADNWVSAPPEGSIAINLMEDWKLPRKDDLTTYPHQGGIYARAFGWERLGHFFDRLEKKGLAIINTGSFTGQSIAGPLSVATHGSGASFGAMADGVVEIDILGADGQVRRIKRADWPKRVEPVELPRGMGSYLPHYIDIPFDLAVVNLGCFGIVLSYVLQVTDSYRLQQTTSMHGLEDGLKKARLLNADAQVRHVELVMVPEPIDIGGEERQVVLIERRIPAPGTPDTKIPGLPFPADLVPLLGRWGQSQVGKLVQNNHFIRKQMLRGALTSQKPFVHDWRGVLVRDTGVYAHSFEVHVPEKYLIEAAEVVCAGILSAAAQGTYPSAPVGVRFVKAGSQAMAMNHDVLDDEDVDLWCTFEVPRLLGSDRPWLIVGRILAELEAAGIPFRPHWGQYFPESLPVASRYPRLDEWLDAREQLDPSGAFFPPRLKARLSAGRGASVAQVEGDTGQRRVLAVLPSHATPGGPWQQQFEASLQDALEQRLLTAPHLVWIRTDDLFDSHQLDPSTARQALLDVFGVGSRYHLNRGRSVLGELPEDPDWQPHDLAAWLTEPGLREQLRIRLYNAMVEHRPDVVIAHGSGSLPVFDTTTHVGFAPRSPFDLVTLASPIAHVGLRRLWGGGLPRPRNVRHWFHAYHRDDPFFVGPVRRSGAYDVEVRDPTERSNAVHDLVTAPAVVRDVWNVVFGDAQPQQRTRLDARRHRRRARKALLVGIDTYLDPAFADLEGSVNDVLAMSELLQSRYGYRAEDIRILTDTRATADALRDRLEWLLAGTTSLDQRVFYFSGHGTQLPAYNALEVVDRVDECLVTHDFDWKATDRAFVDDDFMELYSQLPHGARFTAIFDCCHAAGMSRAGGGQVRGVGLPEDVLHRMRRFVGGEWAFRQTQPRHDAVRKPTRHLATGQLGAARGLRPMHRTQDTDPDVRGHAGPFLPVLLYATQERDLAYEYRDGRQVRGAFSWALTRALERDPTPTYGHLLESITSDLVRAVGFQRPDLEGPAARLDVEPDDRRAIFDL